jgi:hypothetical protein
MLMIGAELEERWARQPRLMGSDEQVHAFMAGCPLALGALRELGSTYRWAPE